MANSSKGRLDAPLPPCEAGAADQGIPAPKWAEPVASGGAGGYLAAHDPAFAETYPVLCQWLTLVGLRGTQRKSGTLLLFAEEGKWKGCINDRDGGRYAFVSAESVAGLLEGLDRSLKLGNIEWRVSKKK